MFKLLLIVALELKLHYNSCFKCETNEENFIMSKEENSQLSELTRLGIKFYKEKLKPILEPEHNGEFVAIEPYSEQYFISEDHTKVIQNARNELPNKLFFVAKVGTIYTAKLRNYVPRKRQG